MNKEFFNSIEKETYTKRSVDLQWMELVQSRADVSGKIAVDIGAGGGIYSIALAELGALKVIGVDISENMIAGARENCREDPQISFQVGTASESNLPGRTADVLLERALIHHLKNHQLRECFAEAKRILNENGVFIIQDRTIEDCSLAGSDEHIRGYFFELYPELLKKDIARRHSAETIHSYLTEAGFQHVEVLSFWENRKTYHSLDELKQEIISRKGRSILFELNDEQVQILADGIGERVTKPFPLVEKERWTIWFARA
ncbi:class I SAM-dependent methyltransferase [Bacillus salipaludis]|uniref:class I SAM-dependent methyltransferase n=1 Tax=Bacillus salipaludis TaxID=2547811 RepID=UPI003D1A91C1